MNFLPTLSEPNVIAGIIATALIVAVPAAWAVWFLRRRVQNLRQDLVFTSAAQRRDNAIVEASGEGVLEIDSADRVRYANPAAARLLGYESSDELIGLNFRTLINDSEERASRVIRRGATTDLMTGMGAVLKRKDGKRRPVEYRVVPITPHRGPGGMVLAFRDVSERVRLDALLSDMQTTALVGGWEYDLVTERIFWTDAVYAIHDLVAGTLLTLEMCQSFFAEPYRAQLQTALEQARVSGVTSTLQLPLTSARGRHIWVRLIIKADRRGGETVRLHGVIQDVTDRVIAEQQVAETRDFYELTLNAIPTLVLYVDRNQVVTYVNKAVEEFAGLTRADCVGRALSAFYSPEEFALIAGHVDSALRGAAGALKHSTTRSGRTRDWQIHFVPELEPRTDGASGAVRGFFVIGYDLTEIKRLEARLLQAQKMEAIGQLTGGIAHDFNNLLGVVLGNLQLLERGVDDNPNLARKVHTAMRAAMRGADLTRRLLALARRQMLDPNVVDLNRQLTGLADLMQRTLGESIEVRMVQAHDLWHTRVDAGQFENAILNLAINARDAMVGGGRLTVRTQNVRLDADFTREHPQVEPGEYVSVSVTDNGVGIEPEVLTRVFEPFFTTKESGRGSGLGLAMVHGFAEQAGGVATISSEVGKGTTVQLLLPRCREENSVREDTIVTRFAPKGHETILVVEDDADLRETVVTALTQFGYRALAAANAERALQILNGTDHVDLLFTDIMMPGGTLGPELARRARELRPGIEVLFTTGYADSAVLSGGISAADVLHKPYRNEELALRVRHVLDREARVA
ncbi:MAG TPA: PAS domain S-box protein [Povalibacter sp.]|nr:PAS domain S-box protein [Povalibacter sp.]